MFPRVARLKHAFLNETGSNALLGTVPNIKKWNGCNGMSTSLSIMQWLSGEGHYDLRRNWPNVECLVSKTSS